MQNDRSAKVFYLTIKGPLSWFTESYHKCAGLLQPTLFYCTKKKSSDQPFTILKTAEETCTIQCPNPNNLFGTIVVKSCSGHYHTQISMHVHWKTSSTKVE